MQENNLSPSVQSIHSKLVPWQNDKQIDVGIIGTAEISNDSFRFTSQLGAEELRFTLQDVASVTTFPGEIEGTYNVGISLKDSRDFMLEDAQDGVGLFDPSYLISLSKERGLFLDVATPGTPAMNFFSLPKYVYIMIILIIVAVVIIRLLAK